jgi:hypothetical protein
MAAFVALFLLPSSADAAEFYYVVVFASEGDFLLPRHAHTFATFVKAIGEGPCPNAYSLEAHTISWMPAAGEIRVARISPERGTNMDLPATLRWAQSVGAHVSRWGPFQIRKELYDRARAQIVRLDSLAVEYKTLDFRLRPDSASNCLHALLDLDQDDGLALTGFSYGEGSGYVVTDAFRRWMINPAQTHEWVYVRLGLCGCPITARTCTRMPAR